MQEAIKPCRCGHTIEHHAVHAEVKDGPFGLFLLLLGVGGTPKEVTWRCKRCGDVLGTSRDPAVLRTFR